MSSAQWYDGNQRQVLDGTLVTSGGSQPVRLFQGSAAPTAPTNTDFYVQVPGAPNTSGTFKLSLGGQETAAIAFDATGDEIAAALCLISTVGAGNAVAYPGYEASTPNDTTAILFVGDFLGEAVATPTVTSDTTDNGVETADDVTGAAGTPAAAVSGDLYVRVPDGQTPGANSPVWVLSAATVPAWTSLTTWGGVLSSGMAAIEVSPGVFSITDSAGNAVFAAQNGNISLSQPSQVNFRNADAGTFPAGIPGVFWVYPYDPTPGAAWWIHQLGHEVTSANTEPADGDIQPGECFAWFEDTNGAAKFWRKGKTADGTVVKTSASMAP